jgi:heme-degrading monooxygenase HmoA
MANPIIRIHDVSTNQVIDREMTDAEFAQWESEQAVQAWARVAAEIKATEKAALLAKLGITDAEAKLLLS